MVCHCNTFRIKQQFALDTMQGKITAATNHRKAVESKIQLYFVYDVYNAQNVRLRARDTQHVENHRPQVGCGSEHSRVYENKNVWVFLIYAALIIL